jgi:hypothetical protein
MSPTYIDPVPLAGDIRAGNDHAGRLISSISTTTAKTSQDVAAAIVAERYRLTPCMARLVCFLAEIGRAAA